MKTVIDEIEEYVNQQNNIIARIGNDLALSMNYINAIRELIELRNKLENMFGDFCFTLKPIHEDNFQYVNLEVFHIEQDGIGYTVAKRIINTELNFSYLYWIDPMVDGIRFRYVIRA